MSYNKLSKGLSDGIPICLGYLAVSFAFGISAVGLGLSWLETLLISALNLTSAGQLAGVGIIAGGGSLIEMAISQLVINSRYSLMSVSLSQKLSSKVSLLDRFLIAFGNTDEIFAVSISKDRSVGKRYMYGLILSPYLGWTIGTLLGAVLGNILPSIVIASLGLAIYGMFIAIVVPVIKREPMTALCVLAAIVLSCLFKYSPLLSAIPSGFVIIICAVIPSLMFAFIAPINTEEVDSND